MRCESIGLVIFHNNCFASVLSFESAKSSLRKNKANCKQMSVIMIQMQMSKTNFKYCIANGKQAPVGWFDKSNYTIQMVKSQMPNIAILQTICPL